MKGRKRAKLDQIEAEFFKLRDKEDLEKLTAILRSIYELGRIPS